MNLLTTDQIAKATEKDLYDTWNVLSERIDDLEEQTALDTARQTLADHGITDALQLRFHVQEWENGYFYSNAVTEASIAGLEVELPRVVLDALGEALEEPLRELGYHGPKMGRRHHMTIDLALNTVIR